MKTSGLTQYRAVLFDLDGTLIDSEKLYHRFWMEAAHALGFPMDDSFANQIRSLDNRLCRALFERTYHDKTAYTRIHEKRIELMDAYIASDGIKCRCKMRKTGTVRLSRRLPPDRHPPGSGTRRRGRPQWHKERARRGL